MEFGVPQGSVLGPVLSLVYINDIHAAIKFSTTRLLEDDTNLLIKNKSLKQLKNHLNIDLCNLSRLSKANKISLNASKTDVRRKAIATRIIPTWTIATRTIRIALIL